MEIFKQETINMYHLFIAIFSMLLLTMGHVSMKYGMNALPKIESFLTLFDFETMRCIFTNEYIIIGLLFYGGGTFLWLGALSIFDLSFIYPLGSFIYVLIAIISFFLFKEHISSIRWLGIFSIIVGTILISRS